MILTYFVQNKIKQNNNEIVITPNLKTKLTTLKKKFNIKSSETSFKKNKKSITKNKIKTINNINNIDIVPLPLNSSNTNLTLPKLPDNFINSIKNKFNKKKIDSITNFDFIFNNILISFINSKIIYTKIFENNGSSLINKIDNFISVYKKIVTTKDKYKGFNIVIRLHNDTGHVNQNDHSNHSKYTNDSDEKYIIMKKNTLIKINNTNTYKNIFNVLEKNKIFILNNSDNYYVGYGNIFNSNINSEQIKEIFFNKVNLSDEKIKNNYEMFCKFKKITLIYWISTPIYF